SFLLPPEQLTVNALLTTGSITTDTPGIGPFADIKRFRFMLECDGASFIGCPETGAEVSFGGGIVVGATCVDASAAALEVQSSVVANEVTFTFGHTVSSVFTPTALRLAPGNTTGCTVSFNITVQSHDTDATPNIIEQDLGYDQVAGDA